VKRVNFSQGFRAEPAFAAAVVAAAATQPCSTAGARFRSEIHRALHLPVGTRFLVPD